MLLIIKEDVFYKWQIVQMAFINGEAFGVSRAGTATYIAKHLRKGPRSAGFFLSSFFAQSASCCQGSCWPLICQACCTILAIFHMLIMRLQFPPDVILGICLQAVLTSDL